MMRAARFALLGLVLAVTGCMVGGEGSTVDTGGPSGGANGGGYGGPGTGGHGGDGTGSGGGGGGGGGMSTPSDVMTKMDHADCDQAFACKATFPNNLGYTFQQAYGDNVNDCYDLATEYYDANQIASSIAAGTITFDAQAGDACVASAIPAADCGTRWTQGPLIPNSCWNSVIGHVADGAACNTDFECAGGSYCDYDTSRCTVAQ